MNATLAVQSKKPSSNEFGMEDILRHMILNSIRYNKVKFQKEFGNDIVIACDGRKCWRYEFFPYYKAKRREVKEISIIDWKEVYQCFNKIRDEIKENFPYHVIHLENAEADDVIGTICKKFGRELGGEPILILSGDKDFAQLQKYSNVHQYDPTRKKWIKKPDPEAFLFEHIIRGDGGDGVPNIFSKDSIFISEGRQTPIHAKKVDKWIPLLKKNTPIHNIFNDQEVERNWSRNETLISFEKIPDNVCENILLDFENQKNKPNKIFNYFIKNKLKLLMESINEF